MGQVREVWLFCYLVLLPSDSRTAAPSWPDPYTVPASLRGRYCMYFVSLKVCLIFLYIFIPYSARFNSLWPSNAIWWHSSGSTLTQIIACWLMAPSHCMHPLSLVISKVHWHSSVGNFTWDTQSTLTKSTKRLINLTWTFFFVKFNSNIPGSKTSGVYFILCICLSFYS